MARELLEPVVDAGVRLTNFFNGRVLTAEDLRREQDAARERHRGLAVAVGEGVVRGLEVTAAQRGLPNPTVRVSAGLAFNREGDPLVLQRQVELRLIPAAAGEAADAGIFGLCERPTIKVEVENPGFYLLALRPASTLSREQVAAVDLTSTGVATRCASRYSEQGVIFSLVPLPFSAGSPATTLAQELARLIISVTRDVESARRGNPPDVTLQTRLAKDLSKLRNGMAYWCAGHDAPGQRLLSLAVGRGSSSTVLSPIDALRAAHLLASCDLPIALLYVSRRQLEWVDMWAVRRSPLPHAGSDPLSLVNGARARNTAAAMVLQFRDHAGSFLSDGPPTAPEAVAADEWFLFLPQFGIVPVKHGSSAGFAPTTFFPWKPAYNANVPEPVPKTKMEEIIQSALRAAPIELYTKGAGGTLHRFRSDPGDAPKWEDQFVMFTAGD